MKCYKCGEEMVPIMDTAWRRHRDGTKARQSEFLCAECRVFIAIDVADFEDCEELNEMLKEGKV